MNNWLPQRRFVVEVLVAAIIVQGFVSINGWSVARNETEIVIPRDMPTDEPFYAISVLPEDIDSSLPLPVMFALRRVAVYPSGRRLKKKQAFVNIDPATGFLRLGRKSQGRRPKNMTVTVSVTSSGNSTPSVTEQRDIVVLFTGNGSEFCELEKEMCFSGQSSVYNILESSVVGEPFDILLHPAAYVMCPHLNFSYDILFGGDNFTVSSDTGTLRLKAKLDAEEKSLEEFAISCSVYQDDYVNRYRMNGTVVVVDVNDNAPTTQSGVYTRNMSYFLRPETNSLKLQVNVVDRDSENVNKLDVQIQDDVSELFFVEGTHLYGDVGKQRVTFFNADIHSQQPLLFPNSTYNFQIVFEDLALRSPVSQKVVFYISITNQSYILKDLDPENLFAESYEFNVSLAAASFSRVHQFVTLLAADGMFTFNINNVESSTSVVYDVLDITKHYGILFIRRSEYLSNYRSGDTLFVNVTWTFTGKQRHVPVSVRFEESDLPPKDCGKTWCSAYTDEESCAAACAYGSVSGRCVWRNSSKESLSKTYATCSPDLVACPDMECDELEQMVPTICPLDCAASFVGEVVLNKTSGGLSSAVGTCSCPSIDRCVCVRKYTDQENDSTEFSSTDFPGQYEERGKVIIFVNTSSAEEDLATVPEESWLLTCGQKCYPFAILGLCTTLILFFSPFILWLVKRKPRRRRRNRLKFTESPFYVSASVGEVGNQSPSSPPSSSPAAAAADSIRTSSYEYRRIGFEIEKKWLIPRSNLHFCEVLGEGEFGRVVKAEAVDINGCPSFTTVAVKMLKGDATEKDRKDFLLEFNLLKEVNHTNVIRLLGACLQRNKEFYIVVEYAELGSLRTYLQRLYPNSEGEAAVPRRMLASYTKKELLSYSWQIAKGMAHLAAMKVLHRDLAARNVLLTATKVAKISDFGLSRDVYEENAYLRQSRGRVPVKWMAIESLEDNIYTTKSDVWSFGIVLWEIMSLGATPYPGTTPERMYLLLKAGYRMEKPVNCPDEIYVMMQHCWREKPNDRPSFKSLVVELEGLLTDTVDYLNLESETAIDIGYIGGNRTEAFIMEQLPEQALSSSAGMNYTSLQLNGDDDDDDVEEENDSTV